MRRTTRSVTARRDRTHAPCQAVFSKLDGLTRFLAALLSAPPAARPFIGDRRKMSALRCNVLATDSDDGRSAWSGICLAQRENGAAGAAPPPGASSAPRHEPPSGESFPGPRILTSHKFAAGGIKIKEAHGGCGRRRTNRGVFGRVS